MVHLDLKIKVRVGISGFKRGWMMHFFQYLKPNACYMPEILKNHTHPLLASVLCIQLWQTLLLHWHLKFYSIKECRILHTSHNLHVGYMGAYGIQQLLEAFQCWTALMWVKNVWRLYFKTLNDTENELIWQCLPLTYICDFLQTLSFCFSLSGIISRYGFI